MNYRHPELLSRLADDYVLGTMPVRSRRRFEAILRELPEARRALTAAEERLLPFAEQLPPKAPPPQVWAAIEKRVQPASRTASAGNTAQKAAGWWQSLAFWRSGAMVAMGLFLALGILQLGPRFWSGAGTTTTAGMGGLAQSYVAVLSDRGETPAYLISAQRYQRDVHIKVLRPPNVPEGKVLRLWALPANGVPMPLGDLPVKDKGKLELVASAEDVLSKIPFLGISVEAAGSSAGGKPSGEFIYRGPCVKLW